MNTHTSIRRAVLAALALSCACQGYPLNRLLDLSDIVDLKYGPALGIGVKVEASDYLGAGVGFASSSADEWYGRRRTGSQTNSLLGVGVVSLDGPIVEPDETSTYTILGFQSRGTRPPVVSRARVGAELWLPGATGGIYVNLGELVDFVLGWFGADIAGDDGVEKGTLLDTGHEDEAGRTAQEEDRE